MLDCHVKPTQERSEFWNIRVNSAQKRGADASIHSLLDYSLKTVEMGLHPVPPDPISFIVGSFKGDETTENPDIHFPVELFHRSSRITIDSDQFVSIHEKVVWVDDSSGRMGVVGGEPLPVIGQPEGVEPGLRISGEGEDILQPFDSIHLLDDEDNIND